MGRELEDRPILLAQAGPLNGQRFLLDHMLVIGRESSCDISIPNRQVSRFHARLVPSASGITLEDLGSKNGTHRNGEVVSDPVKLMDGDQIQIALIQSFLFFTSDATLPLNHKRSQARRLKVDIRSRSVWVNEVPLDPPLSALQFHVLTLLYENDGQVVDRRSLVISAWGEEEAVGVSDEAIDALLRRLRDRISSVDSERQYIVTVRGHGIRLDNPPIE